MAHSMSLEERFWSKVDQTGDCWLWTAGLDSSRYGRFRVGHRQVLAHRFAYELMVGPAAPNLDHRATCPRHCVHPLHLRPATPKQNAENRVGTNANNKSGVRGVSWSKGAWRGYVKHDGKTVYVGSFADIGDAEKAVIAKRLELFTYNDLDRVA